MGFASYGTSDTPTPENVPAGPIDEQFAYRSLGPDSSHGTVGRLLGVEDEFAGREQFTVGMERSGCRRSLLRGEGLSDTEPREGEFHGGHRGTESLGGGAIELGCRGVVGLGCRPTRGGLAGVVGGGGCCGHNSSDLLGGMAGLFLPCPEGYAAPIHLCRVKCSTADLRVVFPRRLTGDTQNSRMHCDALITVPINDPNGEESYQCCQCQKGFVVDWAGWRIDFGC